MDSRKLEMVQHCTCAGRSQMNIPSIRRPSGFLPFAMSAVALGMVLIHAAIYGIVHEADEGTPAHIFQLLMVAQLPVVACFAITGQPARRP